MSGQKMKISAMSYVEIFFVVLIVLTIAMRVHDRLPASSEEIATVQTLASSNDAARLAVAASLSAGSMNKGELRHLREQVAALEAPRLRVDEQAPQRTWQRLLVERRFVWIVGAIGGLSALAVVSWRSAREATTRKRAD